MVVVYVIVWGLYERVLIGLGVVLWVGWGVMGSLVFGWVLGVEKKM